MLGVFTVIITFDQKNSATNQRLDDRRLAEEQRDQDLNISHQQRREDKELSREQRLQDLNQSRLQRELERALADETRNLNEQRRMHEFEIEDKRYRDALLTIYMREMSDWLEKTNGSLTNISLTATLVRLKTLTLIRQLDSNRNSQVIRFLYEAGQLNACKKLPLDLSDAEFLGIDMSSRKNGNKMHNLHLPGVDLTGSSFVNRDLTGTNFSGTVLIAVNFSFSILTNTDFSDTIFNGSFNIYKTALKQINFAFANLAEIDFTKTLLNHEESFEYANRSLFLVNFTNANLENTRFSGLELFFIHFCQISDFVDFSNALLACIMFESVLADNFNFSYSRFTHNVTFLQLDIIRNSSFFMAELNDIKFSNTNGDSLLTNIRFDFAKLRKVSFFGTFIEYSSFINVTITKSTFNTVSVTNRTFINMTMSEVNLDGTMDSVNFDNAVLQNDVAFSVGCLIVKSSFRRAQMQNIIAELCEFISVDMSNANLTNSKMFASKLILNNLINTDFTGVNLSMANLSHSNMFNAHITDEQLHSAISIENSILPNGTIAHDIPLIRNGNADCNRIVEEDWKVEPPNSITLMKWTTYNHSFNNEADCMFLPTRSLMKNSSMTSVTMSQRINVTRYTPLFNSMTLKFHLASDCNQHVKINITERDINDQILNDWIFEENDYNSLPNIKTTDIEINLEFDINANNIAICDNIRFDIKLFCIMCSSHSEAEY